MTGQPPPQTDPPQTTTPRRDLWRLVTSIAMAAIIGVVAFLVLMTVGIGVMVFTSDASQAELEASIRGATFQATVSMCTQLALAAGCGLFLARTSRANGGAESARAHLRRVLGGWPRQPAWIWVSVALVSASALAVLELTYLQWAGSMPADADILALPLFSVVLPPNPIKLVVAILLAPLVEETLFRGLAWTSLEALHGTLFAWLTTSVLFALVHFNPASATLGLLHGGLLLGALRAYHGSVAPSVATHVVMNGLTAIGGTWPLLVPHVRLPLALAVPLYLGLVALIGVLIVRSPAQRALETAA